MQVFDYVLLLLVAILISNIINRFLPYISVPIIQISLGMLITLLPLEFELHLEPHLFFTLFIAPLLFYDGMMSDKKSLWTLKRPIMQLALGLVFLTVLAVGYLVHLLIPSIPLAAAFALTAALAPTDAVAVSSLAKRINMPHQIMNILEGEALVNDASGLVSFQFAIAAMLTGTFSLINAGITFFIIAIGGIFVGLIFTLLKYILVRKLRSMGMENVTLHLLLVLLTPFIIYLAAEALEVSGILAVVASGIAHSFSRKRFHPETVSLNIASDSVWSVLVFSLNGLVFLILGTQFPTIVETVVNDASVNTLKILVNILAITFTLMLVRYLWALFAIDKKHYTAQEQNKYKACLIIGLSGVRGAVTLATALSIPFLLNDGVPFPERNLIIFIASGVIICYLLSASFLLPLVVGKEAETNSDKDEAETCIQIFLGVISQLNNQANIDNKHATEIVARNYYRRISDLQKKQNNGQNSVYNENQKREKANIKHLLKHWKTLYAITKHRFKAFNNEDKDFIQSHIESSKLALKEVSAAGFQIERDEIQAMFEEGRISRDTAKKMRKNISLLEAHINEDENH